MHVVNGANFNTALKALRAWRVAPSTTEEGLDYFLQWNATLSSNALLRLAFITQSSCKGQLWHGGAKDRMWCSRDVSGDTGTRRHDEET